MQIVQLDLSDDAAFDAWYATYKASETHDRPWHAAWSVLEMRVGLRSKKAVLKIPLSAILDGRCVGGAIMELPLLDNLTHAYLELFVHPDHWDDGVADALLDQVERIAHKQGRSQLMAWLAYPLGGQPTDDPFVATALRRGFEQVMTEYQRALDLPLDVPAVVAPEGYRLVTFDGPPPPEFTAGVRALHSSFDTEAPSGVEFEASVVDDDTEAERWAAIAEMDRTVLTTIAVSDAGEVAAYTYFAIPHTGDWLFQDATLVAPAHRGHRLGIAIKLANLAELQRRFPAKRSVRTWNAGDNAWMVAINDALGYRPVEAMAELVMRLPRSRTPGRPSLP